MELDDQSPEIIEYKAITGNFGNVRYFITTLDQSDAVENIRFADELQKNWSFSERVQRKLDKKRAEGEIFQYLAKGGIRFFNSLVVVPLPNNLEQQEFWDYEEVTAKGKKVEKWVNLKLYKNVSRVVIDGQHRLLALRKHWKIKIGEAELSSTEKQENCQCHEQFDIPVIYLVFGDLGRFHSEEEYRSIPDEHSESIRDQIIRAVRNIFTVINKTAKPIDKYSTLLLDDTKLAALIPRKLLEEEVLEDRVVKWSQKSMSLRVSDPYLTTLDVVSKCVDELLRDYKKEALQRSLNSQQDRKLVLENYYNSHPKLQNIGSKRLLRWYFYNLQPFKDWFAQIEHMEINIPLQPETVEKLTKQQSDALKELRKSNIMYTVIGQRVVFASLVRFLMRIPAEERVIGILERLSQKINQMHNDGFFDRTAEHWKHILVQPNMTMILKSSEPCIERLRGIFRNDPTGVRRLVQNVKDKINEEISWSESSISEWRSLYHIDRSGLVIDEQQNDIGIVKEITTEVDSTANFRETSFELEEDEEVFDEDEDFNEDE